MRTSEVEAQSLPALLFNLVVSGQIKLRKIDGWRKIAAMLSQQTAAGCLMSYGANPVDLFRRSAS